MYSYFLFLICSIYPTLLYFYWKYGHKVRIFKYLTIPSVAGVLLTYLFNFNDFRIVDYSNDLFIRVLFFFLLCFLMAITIIVFATSSLQENNAEKVQPLIIKEKPLPKEKIEISYTEKGLINKESDVNLIPNHISANKEKTVETNRNLNFNNNPTLEPKNVKKNQKKDESLTYLKNMLKKLSEEESREFLD